MADLSASGHARGSGACGGQRIAQLAFHFLEIGLGLRAPRFAFIGDPQAVLNGGDQLRIGGFHGFNIEDAALHLFADDGIGLAQVLGVGRQQFIRQIIRRAQLPVNNGSQISNMNAYLK